MKYIYIGDIVSTHGIKGEVKVISNFRYKDIVFSPPKKVYLGSRKEELKIIRYRTHKNYDMLTFEGIDDINDVIIYKGDKVFASREDIDSDIILDEDLIGLSVIVEDKIVGKINHILKGKAQDIISIKGNDKDYMVPYVEEFIKKIDLKNKEIIIENIKGLIDEN